MSYLPFKFLLLLFFFRIFFSPHHHQTGTRVVQVIIKRRIGHRTLCNLGDILTELRIASPLWRDAAGDVMQQHETAISRSHVGRPLEVRSVVNFASVSGHLDTTSANASALTFTLWSCPKRVPPSVFYGSRRPIIFSNPSTFDPLKFLGETRSWAFYYARP